MVTNTVPWLPAWAVLLHKHAAELSKDLVEFFKHSAEISKFQAGPMLFY